MRLLHAKERRLVQFSETHALSDYCILSHVWNDQDVTFHELDKTPDVAENKPSYQKIVRACEQTTKDNIEYLWIDHCCVDRTSFAELSESTHMLFRLYREATYCYALFDDVGSQLSAIKESNWFSNSWTLQALLAPHPEALRFYSADWQYLGTKSSQLEELSQITNIPSMFLRGIDLNLASVAQKMSWASSRTASRPEDTTYALLGLFNIHIPLLYGEGSASAFLRLQKEIVHTTYDPSIFAWGLGEDKLADFSKKATDSELTCIFAPSPSAFAGSADIIPDTLEDDDTHNHKTTRYELTNLGVRIGVSWARNLLAQEPPPDWPADKYWADPGYAVLRCRPRDDPGFLVAIPVGVSAPGSEVYARRGDADALLVERDMTRGETRFEDGDGVWSVDGKEGICIATGQGLRGIWHQSQVLVAGNLEGKEYLSLPSNRGFFLRKLSTKMCIDGVSKPDKWDGKNRLLVGLDYGEEVRVRVGYCKREGTRVFRLGFDGEGTAVMSWLEYLDVKPAMKRLFDRHRGKEKEKEEEKEPVWETDAMDVGENIKVQKNARIMVGDRFYVVHVFDLLDL